MEEGRIDCYFVVRSNLRIWHYCYQVWSGNYILIPLLGWFPSLGVMPNFSFIS